MNACPVAIAEYRHNSGDALVEAVEKFVRERVLRDCAFSEFVKKNPRLLNAIVDAYIDQEYCDLEAQFIAELADDA